MMSIVSGTCISGEIKSEKLLKRMQRPFSFPYIPLSFFLLGNSLTKMTPMFVYFSGCQRSK